MSRAFIWTIAAISFIWLGLCIGLYVGRRAISMDVAVTLCQPIKDRFDYAVCVQTAVRGVMYSRAVK